MDSTNGFCTKNCSNISELEHKYQFFISKFSHEARNQLTLINSSLQLIAKEHPDLSGSALWSQTLEDVHDTISLLQDTTAYTKNTELNSRLIHPDELLHKVAGSFYSNMEEKEILFSDVFHPNLANAFIFADELKLKEAITNLLLNAMDAVSETSAAQKRISFTSETDSHFLIIHVKDNGCGIPASHLDTIFDPFVTYKAHGTGLGLAIVKKIVEQHQGLLSVDTCSEPPHTYTDFCLKIPLC